MIIDKEGEFPVKKGVGYTLRQLDFLTLIGRGMPHKQIGSELAVTTDSSQTIVRGLILKAGYVTDIQTVVYCVGSGQIDNRGVFVSDQNKADLLVPNPVDLTPGQARIINNISWGSYRHRDPDVNLAPQTITSEAFRIRQRWGLHSNTQVVLTAIDRGYTSYEAVLALKRETQCAQDSQWGNLSAREQYIVRGVWLNITNKELATQFRVSVARVGKLLGEFREKVGVSNDYQLALKYSDVPELDPIDMFPNMKLKVFSEMGEAEHDVLNTYIANDGENFNDPRAVEESLRRPISEIYKIRDRIKLRTGFSSMEQLCLIYLYAIQGEYLDKEN